MWEIQSYGHNYRIATAEVAYIQRQFAVARFFLKNRNGIHSKGSDFAKQVM